MTNNLAKYKKTIEHLFFYPSRRLLFKFNNPSRSNIRNKVESRVKRIEIRPMKSAVVRKCLS